MTYPGGTTYPGAGLYPGGGSTTAVGIQFPYLGKPGAMLRLPSWNSAYTAPPQMGETVHVALSGGSSTTSRLYAKRPVFTLPFEYLEPADADLITGFYLRLFGFGPYVFVDPSVRNVLGLDVSTVGVRGAAALNWIQSAGTLTRATGAPVTGSGVLTWSGLSASASLTPGTTVANVITSAAPVYLPNEPVTVSLWAKASAATTAGLYIASANAAGNITAAPVSASMSVTTTWQRFTCSANAGDASLAGSAFVVPRVVLGASVPTSLSIAGVQLEYASTGSDWQAGNGSPRVVITSTPGREVPLLAYSNHTLTLGEV